MSRVCETCGETIVFAHHCGSLRSCPGCETKDKRIQELLELVAKLSRETPYPDEFDDLEARVAKLIAEVGTLRARLRKEPG
jgi:hypothetical protein